MRRCSCCHTSACSHRPVSFSKPWPVSSIWATSAPMMGRPPPTPTISSITSSSASGSYGSSPEPSCCTAPSHQGTVTGASCSAGKQPLTLGPEARLVLGAALDYLAQQHISFLDTNCPGCASNVLQMQCVLHRMAPPAFTTASCRPRRRGPPGGLFETATPSQLTDPGGPGAACGGRLCWGKGCIRGRRGTTSAISWLGQAPTKDMMREASWPRKARFTSASVPGFTPDAIATCTATRPFVVSL